MERDIKQIIKEFDNSGADPFSTSDYLQIKDLVVKAMNGGRGINALLYHSIDYALRAGYMIGRAAAAEG